MRTVGTDVSPQAIALSRSRTNGKLHSAIGSEPPNPGKLFDLVMTVDVLAHVEDYRAFLRKMKTQGVYKLIHIPLDLSVQHLLRGKSMSKQRKLHPHLHYFCKRTAMFALEDLGYEIVDHFYTPRMIAIPTHWRGHVLRLPRKFLFAVNQELAVNLLGGFSLMILSK